MLTRADLWSLEEYAERRAAFRADVLAHKKNRQVLVGNHLLLLFEDQLTLKYQIQEMLRIEKVFEASGINDELEAYNPLIPNGDNWKCTLLIQYNDVDERKRRLAELIGVEDQIWMQVGETKRIYPITDEDMDRTTADKTSAVHFMRYQLSAEQIEAVKAGAAVTVGVDHLAFPCESVLLPENVRQSLLNDLG